MHQLQIQMKFFIMFAYRTASAMTNPVQNIHEASTKTTRGTEHVEALARGLKVLQAFDQAHRRFSLSQVARRVALPRATVRRILYTLETLGFVARDEKLFWLTPDVLKLANAYLTSNGLSQALQAVCEEVTGTLAQACSAAVLMDGNAVFVARARPASILSVGLEVGYRLPFYCTSVGRILSSGLADEALDKALGDLEPKALTDHTLTDIALIRSAILTARHQGYCIVDQEAETGFRSIAVPVRRPDGQIAAALNIGAHAETVSIGRMIDDFLPVLEEAAGRAGSLIC